MEFAYQEYVKRLNYEPYRWPPDISLAQLHSRVSEQGPIDPLGVKCPCCGFQSKKQFKGWFSRDVNEDCRGFGNAIPAFFGLLMYYTIAIFGVICLNSIYNIYAIYYVCDNLVYLSDYECLKFGFLYYIDFNFLIQVLIATGNQGMVDKLIILQTITFYFLVVINLSSLAYLYFMDGKERQEQQYRRFENHALILGNLPDPDPEKVRQKLAVATKLRIVDIIPLKNYKRYHDLFHKRNMIYFKLMSKYVKCKDPRTYKSLNKRLAQFQQQFMLEKKRIKQADHSNLMIFFKRSFQRTLVLNSYSLNQLQKIEYGSKQVMEDVGFKKDAKWDMPIYVIKVPEINEINWENAGQDIKAKLAKRLVTFFIALGLLVFCFFIFIGPLSWSLTTKTNNPANLSTFQKSLPIIISIILYFISMSYHNYMKSVAKQRFPLSQFQASKFVLTASMVFHLIFYIIIPVVFFTIPNQIKTTTKLFVIAQQARTFIVLQLILNIIDVPYQLWKSKKTKCLSDQRQGFQYYQRHLHRIVQYRDFPLLLRIQSMFKIWSFVLFYVFYLPYMVIYMFVALIILYILEKRNFYLHYALRHAIPLKLQKNFLIYFVNFFGLFQCFAYCYNALHTWMIISAITVTLVLLVANIVFWKCIQPEYRHKKAISQGLKQQLIQEQSGTQSDVELEDCVKRAAKQYRGRYEVFVESMVNEELDEQISQYVQSLQLNIKDITPEEREVVERLIELPESELENNLE